MTPPKKQINISERKVLLRIIDVLVIMVSMRLSCSYLSCSYLDFSKPLIYLWCTVLIIYYLFFGQVFQLYNLQSANSRYKVLKSIVTTSFFVVLFYSFTPFITPSLPANRLQILYFYGTLSVPVFIWRIVYIGLFYSDTNFKNILVIGDLDEVAKLFGLVKQNGFYKIATYVSTTALPSHQQFTSIENVNLIDLVQQKGVREIIASTSSFSNEQKDHINKQFILLFEKGVNIKCFHGFYEELTERIPKGYLNDKFYSHLNFSKSNNSYFYLFLSRCLDVVFAVFGLIVFVGLLPLIYIGNLVCNRGPLFYHQNRLGKNGTIFRIYKLRSMVTNAEENGAVWAQKNDSRVTIFGKFLRKSRLDEVPQLFNILKGDMALIGPRPERPLFVKKLQEVNPFYSVRNVIKPGLTGWAQVKYPYANTIEEQEIKLRYDLYYIKKRSAFLDFKIIIKTITTVLFFRGQ